MHQEWRKEDERERYWASFSECLAGYETNIVLGDIYAKVGDRERVEIVGKLEFLE